MEKGGNRRLVEDKLRVKMQELKIREQKVMENEDYIRAREK